MPTPLASILVADDADAYAALRRDLPGAWALRHAPGFDAACQALHHRPPDLVMCGCHFDEGRMYDLLRHMKGAPALARVPFLATRVLEGELDDAMYESVSVAVKALGGEGFVDVLQWQRRHGPDEARRRLEAAVSASLHP